MFCTVLELYLQDNSSNISNGFSYIMYIDVMWVRKHSFAALIGQTSHVCLDYTHNIRWGHGSDLSLLWLCATT